MEFYDKIEDICSEQEYVAREADRKAYSEACSRGEDLSGFDITLHLYPGFQHSRYERTFNLSAIGHFEIIRALGEIPSSTSGHRATSNWVSKMRSRRRDGSLSGEHIAFIDRNCESIFSPKKPIGRDEHLALVDAFSRENPDTPVSDFPSALRSRLAALRTKLFHPDAPMTSEDVAHLDSICPVWRHSEMSLRDVENMSREESAARTLFSCVIRNHRLPSFGGFFGDIGIDRMIPYAGSDVMNVLVEITPEAEYATSYVEKVVSEGGSSSMRAARLRSALGGDKSHPSTASLAPRETVTSKVLRALSEEADAELAPEGFDQYLVRDVCDRETYERMLPERIKFHRGEVSDFQYERYSREAPGFELPFMYWRYSSVIQRVRAYFVERGHYEFDGRIPIRENSVPKVDSLFLAEAYDLYLPRFEKLRHEAPHWWDSPCIPETPQETPRHKVSLPEMPEFVTDPSLVADFFLDVVAQKWTSDDELEDEVFLRIA